MASQQIVEPRVGALTKEVGVLCVGIGRSDFWWHEGDFRCVQSMIDGR